jgi:ADP-heptose:LPS heptosyltransferase
MRKVILHNHQSPGDVVMLTAAVRDLKVAHRDWQIDVRTSAPDLWDHNPHLTKLGDRDKGVEKFKVGYPLIHTSNLRPYHFIHGFRKDLERQLKVTIPQGEFRGDIHLSADEKKMPPQVDGDFWIVMAGGKMDFTAKWWNPASYQEVVDRLAGQVQFVQCGMKKHWHPALRDVVDLIGKTSLRQFVRLVYHASGIVCPVTCAMHLAAAVPTPLRSPRNRPCVVIAGGREPMHWEAYPTHQFLHTCGALPCCDKGGCWKSRAQKMGDGKLKDQRGLCKQPVDVGPVHIARCMEMITPSCVEAAVLRYYDGGILTQTQRSQTMPKFKARLEIALGHMKRGAGHPILDWIVSQFAGKRLFLNSVENNPAAKYKQSCRLPSLGERSPITDFVGRELSLVVCSYEDTTPGEVAFQDGLIEATQQTKVLLTRDPFNHLASTVKMGQRRNDWTLIHRAGDTGAPTAAGIARWVARWKEYARECLRIEAAHDEDQGTSTAPGRKEVAINYNRWLADPEYRDTLAVWLNVDGRSDASMSDVPVQGGGSSFDHRKLHGKATAGNYTERWRVFENEDWFRDAFKDAELVDLSEQLFGVIPGTEALTGKVATDETA